MACRNGKTRLKSKDRGKLRIGNADDICDQAHGFQNNRVYKNLEALTRHATSAKDHHQLMAMRWFTREFSPDSEFQFDALS